MREILFRGKRTDNGEWVEGYYVRLYDDKRTYLSHAEADCGDYYLDFYEVSPETIGQYTGLKDKNGVKIFEGDICRLYNGESSLYVIIRGIPERKIKEISLVLPIEISIGKTDDESIDDLDEFFCKRCEVVGNIFDSPELLKVKDKNG